MDLRVLEMLIFHKLSNSTQTLCKHNDNNEYISLLKNT